MVLCAARLNAAIMVRYLACVKTDVEVHEKIRHCGLFYSTDRKASSANYVKFAVRITSEYNDQCVFQVK